MSQLEGEALATAIGNEISLLQSVSGRQPQQAVVFQPQAISETLAPARAELQRLLPVAGPLVLLERPLQGCTVVLTLPAVDRVDAVPHGAVADRRGDIGGGPTEAATERLPSPTDFQDEGGGAESWQCTVCYQEPPPAERIAMPCCNNSLCATCTRRVVSDELARVRSDIRRNNNPGRANGGQQRRRRLPFICPFCRHRSSFHAGALGAGATLALGSPTPRSPIDVDAHSPMAPAHPPPHPSPPTARSRSAILAPLLRRAQLRCFDSSELTWPHGSQGADHRPICPAPPRPARHTALGCPSLVSPVGSRRNGNS